MLFILKSGTYFKSYFNKEIKTFLYFLSVIIILNWFCFIIIKLSSLYNFFCNKRLIFKILKIFLKILYIKINYF